MATARQACEILDATLRLPDGTARWHADRLRGVGHLASTQGRPTQATSNDVALILLSLMLGSPATSAADMVPAYAALRPIEGGPSLGDALAGYIDRPDDFFELSVNTISPGATLTFGGEDHGMRVATYATEDYQPRPAFDRVAIIGADTMTRLSSAISAAPPVRVGPRRVGDRYRRLEYAIQ
ncbi:hypothetical protein ACG873_06635 [Mesorhizobium sp. AaZ16]|uniref:hypothetical protein n=1 Tax=Mesorhizobium sp. AaZ16 TaxID=3402289 RepID=UPI00374F8B93